MSLFNSIAEGLNSFVDAGSSVITNATNQISDVFNNFESFKNERQAEVALSNPSVQSQNLISKKEVDLKTIFVYGAVAFVALTFTLILIKK